MPEPPQSSCSTRGTSGGRCTSGRRHLPTAGAHGARNILTHTHRAARGHSHPPVPPAQLHRGTTRVAITGWDHHSAWCLPQPRRKEKFCFLLLPPAQHRRGQSPTIALIPAMPQPDLDLGGGTNQTEISRVWVIPCPSQGGLRSARAERADAAAPGQAEPCGSRHPGHGPGQHGGILPPSSGGHRATGIVSHGGPWKEQERAQLDR